MGWTNRYASRLSCDTNLFSLLYFCVVHVVVVVVAVVEAAYVFGLVKGEEETRSDVSAWEEKGKSEREARGVYRAPESIHGCTCQTPPCRCVGFHVEIPSQNSEGRVSLPCHRFYCPEWPVGMHIFSHCFLDLAKYKIKKELQHPRVSKPPKALHNLKP